jgi:hypothetical protein
VATDNVPVQGAYEFVVTVAEISQVQHSIFWRVPHQGRHTAPPDDDIQDTSDHRQNEALLTAAEDDDEGVTDGANGPASFVGTVAASAVNLPEPI